MFGLSKPKAQVEYVMPGDYAPVRGSSSAPYPVLDARSPLKARLNEGVELIQELVGRPVGKYEMMISVEAYRLLIQNKFLSYCSNLVGEYHANDCRLRQVLLRGALRASYSSRSGLLHFATTGDSGSGKNDLINNITALLPDQHKILYASITPKALYYAMRVPEANGKSYLMNPDTFRNKIICVTEIRDSKQYDALKAFAELDEASSFTHMTTSGQKNLDLTVRGPRAFWITSVLPVGDGQVRRRFIHNEIEASTADGHRSKMATVTAGLLGQQTIFDDYRMRVAKAGYTLLFSTPARYKGDYIERPAERVALMIADLNESIGAFDNQIEPTQIKQLFALIECCAVEKQFARGYCRIEEEDVREGWWLSGFDCDKKLLLNGEWCTPKEPVGC